MSEHNITEKELARSVAQVRENVERIAHEYPNTKYHSVGGECTYTPDPKNPMGCLIGAAWRAVYGDERISDCEQITPDYSELYLIGLGVDLFAAEHAPARLPDAQYRYVISQRPDHIDSMLYRDLNQRQRDMAFMAVVQNRQDHGDSWLDALNYGFAEEARALSDIGEG